MVVLGLRAALFAVIMLALAPALLLLLRTHSEQTELVQRNADSEVRRLVQLATLDQDRVLDGTRQLLVALAQLPEVRGQQWEACSELFAALFGRYEGYTNLGVADRNGDVRCAAIPNAQRVNITDREYYQRTLAGRTFGVGDYQIGRTTRQPNLGSGYPVLDAAGEVQAVVWAARDLSWLNQHVAAGDLPPGASVMVLDSDGTILARQPNPESWVGQTLAEHPLIQTIITQGEGTVLLPGLDGVERLTAFSVLRSAGGNAYVSVGLSQAALVAEANQYFARNGLGLAVATFFALLLAGIGSELFLMRRVRALTRAAERLRAGDLTARAGGSRVHDELAELATTFDTMADALDERSDNLSRANRQLQEELAERERHVEERAHLVLELEARVGELALLHEIGQSLIKSSDLDAFLDASLDRIMGVGPFDLGVIRLLNVAGQRVERVVSRGYHNPDNAIGVSMSGATGEPARYAGLGYEHAIAIDDLTATPGFRSHKLEGIASLVSVPIRTQESLLGLFVVGSRTPRHFDEGEVRLLDAIGSQLGVATQKARLAEEMAQRDEQLRQAQKMEAVGVLAGGIAHDFNNLLTAIIGFSELLLADPKTTAQHMYLEEIVKAGQRAAGLTSQLLAFSRQQLLQPEVLDLNHVVTDMDRLLRRVIGEDIRVITLRGSSLGSVYADPGQLGQVILNLATNARDAMPTGGTLTIETNNVEVGENDTREHRGLDPGRYVCLTVRDTGHGMDAATQARVFEPFFTTKEQGKGTGLGLATVYGIVQQSGGHVWVESEPGLGTVFQLFLPRHGESVPERNGTDHASDLPSGAETILLVEDEDGVRHLAREVLTAKGYTVLVASNGAQALQLAADYQHPIDLLVTDIVMPGMSGREVATRLTSLRPDTRVLYMSGYTPDVAIRHGVERASVAYIQKPFAPAILIHKVREVLDAELSLLPA